MLRLRERWSDMECPARRAVRKPKKNPHPSLGEAWGTRSTNRGRGMPCPHGKDLFRREAECAHHSFASQDGRGIEACGAAEWECAAEERDGGGKNQDYAEDQQRGLGWYAENSCAEETRK